MESLHTSALEQQLYDQYQCRGKLLACRKYKSVGNAHAHAVFYKEHFRNRKGHCKDLFRVNGWMACHNSDIWAMSNPVGDFGHGDPVWANWYMGGAWLSTHLWEHYLFTQDKEWLKNEGYELMRGAALFALTGCRKIKTGN